MHNEKFAIAPKSLEDAHREASCKNLNRIFCVKEKRVLQNDFTISFRKKTFQLIKQQKTIIRPKNEISVLLHLNDSIELFIRKTKLEFSEIPEKPKNNLALDKKCTPKHYKPAIDHPWRRNYKNTYYIESTQ